MRRVLLAGVLIASTRAFAQPAPAPPPSPVPAPSPSPVPAPAPPVPGTPDGTGSASVPPEATGSAGPHIDPKPTPEPVPASPPVTIPPVKPVTLSATQQRMEAEQVCAAHSPDCDWIATFSSLEKQSVARALTARGLVIDPQPWGKPVARVLVYNENVFAEANWLRFFNFIHYTTRESAIRQELPIQAGDMWDDEKVAESARILHDPLYSSVVALLPIKASEPGKVDLLVVTRDVWSLRFNTRYTFQQGSLTNLSISISENNFLGYRNVLAAAALMDQGSLAVGPLFIDKNLLGKHVYISAQVDAIVTRQSLSSVSHIGDKYVYTPTGDPKGWEDGGGYRHEGNDAYFKVSRPLWSLASEWGAASSFSYSNAISRSYLGTGIRAYDDPRTPEIEMIAREFRKKSWAVDANVIRQWGSVLKQQLSFGYSLSGQHPSLLANTATGPVADLGERALARDFVRDVFPHDEVISQPYVEYVLFAPRYRTLRNLSTYEFPDDIRMGPTLDVTYYQSLEALGSTHTFERPAASFGWTFPVGEDGFVSPSVGSSIRIQRSADGVHDTIDNSAQVSVGAATPTFGIGRIVAHAELQTLWHNTQNTYYTIGSDSGLRGYPINAFAGQRRFSAQLEARSKPYPLWVFRAGGVMFYEAGGAANSLDEMAIYQDVGIGVRALIPQTSRDLFRFDVALPLRASPQNPISPHFIAGFQQYF